MTNSMNLLTRTGEPLPTRTELDRGHGLRMAREGELQCVVRLRGCGLYRDKKGKQGSEMQRHISNNNMNTRTTDSK